MKGYELLDATEDICTAFKQEGKENIPEYLNPNKWEFYPYAAQHSGEKSSTGNYLLV